ncbi:disease resistance protein RPV1-like [Hevea brasiliensis]|uniref:disease resistance protein RPV1-like n=1 Tax=Hevea brasiliensis TaxID=3981 RepID=UPI0025CD2D96|nr:disease resistance protein RPV1-like [Hevea brasiliensis]
MIENLRKGKLFLKNSSKQLKAPKFLVIFSKNYASSTWCLDELVKILECKNSGNQIVLPIFYDVNPSEVRKQNGSFENDSEHYQQNDERVQRWRLAMTQVANLSGWNLQDSMKSLIKTCEIQSNSDDMVDNVID